jgi:crotonobetainyl-CoA:carnitine CoA-transferase CaiB-like acyl-CoA transferase
MAELGADVIKIEDPKGGDYARWMPPLVGDPPTSSLFAELNRGKRSVALDLKNSDARVAFRSMLARADVLMDSFRPGVLARCDLDPRDLMQANPRLIYCAMTGFGLTGPDAQRAGHDIGYLGRSGALAVSGPKDTPTVSGVQIADIGAAFAALSGVVAALFERTRTGVGRVVDVSLTEVGLAFGAAALGTLHGGRVPRRASEVLDGSRPCYSVYRTKDDRFLAVGSLEPKFWIELVRAIGLPELAASGLDSGEAGELVRAKVQERLLEKTRDEWTHVFRDVEACVEPVLEMDEIASDAQHLARHVVADGGFVRGPVRVTDWASIGATGRALAPAPTLGEHTESVLKEHALPSPLIQTLLHPP